MSLNKDGNGEQERKRQMQRGVELLSEEEDCSKCLLISCEFISIKRSERRERERDSGSGVNSFHREKEVFCVSKACTRLCIAHSASTAVR